MSPEKPLSCMRAAVILPVLLVLAAAVTAHGYWYSTSIIDKYVTRCGAYPTVDEAIEGDMRHNGFDPIWFEEYIKGPDRAGNPYTWYVVPKIKPEYQAAYDKAVKPGPLEWCGGSFYHHTRVGWVGMPEHWGNAFGYLDLWMFVFHLHGEDK